MTPFMRSTLLASPLVLALACTHAGSDRAVTSDEAMTAQGSQTVSGRLREITPSSITIAANDGNDRTLRVGAATAVAIDGKRAALGDLEPGQEVRASFGETPDGRKVATRVSAGTEGPPPPDEPMQAPEAGGASRGGAGGSPVDREQAPPARGERR